MNDHNIPVLDGLMPINSSFASIVFEETNAAAKTTTLTVQLAVTLAPESNGGISDPVESFIAYERLLDLRRHAHSLNSTRSLQEIQSSLKINPARFGIHSEHQEK